MKNDSYESKVHQEEELHKQIEHDRWVRKGWQGLSDKQYSEECNKLDSLNYALWRAGLTK